VPFTVTGHNDKNDGNDKTDENDMTRIDFILYYICWIFKANKKIPVNKTDGEGK